MISSIFWIVPVSALMALLFAWIFYRSMKAQEEGTDKMKEIALYVREGAMAYLKRQYSVVTRVFVILVILLAILAYFGIQNPFVPVAFLTGGFFSGLCGYLGMKTATFASNRTAWAASKSLNKGLQVALRSGAVMGLVVVGFGLLDIAIWFLILNGLVFTPENMDTGLKFLGLTFVQPGTTDHEKLIEITAVMLTFGMGASTQALFARVGGGIFTKAADVGADLVGKVEAGIPEDDPRNPATIADNVGDNVGDVAGMGADLYESYAGSILATAALGAALPVVAGASDMQMKAVIAPMLVSAIGILLSIAGVYMVRTKESATPKVLLRALLLGTGGSSALILVVLAIMAGIDWINWGVFGAAVSGLVAGVIIGQSTEYFTSDGNKPTQGIAKQALQGPATVIIEGMAVGMFSTWIPVVTIVGGIIAAYGFAGGFNNFAMGVYGIGFAAVGMLSTLGITLATDAFGPIADNAGGNAEMSELPKEVRERTDALDGLGNTTAATGKGFAIGSAALTALALMAAYMEEVRLWLGRLIDKAPEGFKQIGDTFFYNSSMPQVQDGQAAVNITTATIRDFANAYDLSLFNPILLGGVFIGAMMAFLFSAMSMKAVGRAAGKMVEEVRRQFREIPGIMEGKAKPEYAKCVEISTAGAQSEMLIPSLMAIAVPLVVGVIFGVPGVIGLLAGGMSAGFVLASMLNNAGGAWDNAKKFIERGNFGGKKSEPHKASVVGDTVGDPFKDTSGPALNILIKLMSMVSVVLAGLTVAWSIFG
ncbi:MAG: sodium-translocating pyrophosphatase [Bacteroidetes bacterium RBG_13_42_15]|nr:MAG: sodium-translocating pyrophosphatase [Bacteroidetes bacterium RBG_13_42_15]